MSTGRDPRRPNAWQVDREQEILCCEMTGGYSQTRYAAIEVCLAMPKRTDIKSILIIGAGPIVIGQACEFDYSGTQACKALRAEGYRIILVNSNPATIMTDPDLADATYIEPITPEVVAKIIAKETPGRAAADDGRADRAQHGARARQDGRA